MSATNQFIEKLEDKESIEIVIAKIKEFDQYFTDEIVAGSDFTLRLEVRGNKHRLLHVRVYRDSTDRPKIAGKNTREE